MAAPKKEALAPESTIMVMTTSEYEEYSKKNGRIMGRRPDQKTKCSTEELRVYINAGRLPKELMDKHGMSEEEHKQLVWKLSKEERRDSAIEFNKNGYRR